MYSYRNFEVLFTFDDLFGKILSILKFIAAYIKHYTFKFV